jgi:hypothetical protein
MRLTCTRLLLLCAVSACSSPDLDTFAKEHTTRQERALGQSYLQLLSTTQVDSAAGLLAPNLQNDTVVRTLQQIGALLRDARLDSLRLIGVNVNNVGTDTRELNLSYEVPTTHGRWLTTSVATRSVRGHVSVIGASAHPIPGPLEEINAFSLRGKSLVHYVVLVFAVVVPLFILGVEVVCLRSSVRRRWAWMLLILLGGPVTALNWATGEVHTNQFSVLLFGVGWFRASVYAPGILQVAFPVGAAIFLARRYQLILQARHTTKEGYTKLNLPGGI